MENYIVVVAEKPDMAFKYAAALGGVILQDGNEITTSILNSKEEYIKRQSKINGYFKGVAKRSLLKGKTIIYTWCRGHLATLSQAYDYDPKYKKWCSENFPFIPNDGHYKVKLIDSKDGFAKKQANIIKGLIHSNNCSLVVNGTDAEREGEIIFNFLEQVIENNNKTKRLWLNSTKEEDIIKAFSNLREIDNNLLDSGIARAISDFSTGCNLTALYTALYGNGQMFSIGRVQTCILALLVNREKEILNFKSSKYYQVEATFQKDNKQYKGILNLDEKDKFSIEKANNIKEKINSNIGTITELKSQRENEAPPQFLSLSSLQMIANSRFGYTLTETLNIAQKLYDNTFITYPRTDSKYIPVTEEINLKNRISYIDDKYKKYKDISLNKINKGVKLGNRFVKDTSDAHFALMINNKATNLSEKEQNIYNIISEFSLMPYLGNAEWDKTELISSVDGFSFITKSKILQNKGFRELIKVKEEEQLPKLSLNNNVKVLNIDVLEKTTKPPKRFNDRTLVSAMVNIQNVLEEKEYKQILKQCKGIGTEATRAELLKRLLEVEYVKRDKKSLVPTDKGIWLINNLPLDELKSPVFTAQWEQRLQDIEEGKETLEQFIKDIHGMVIKDCEILKNNKDKIKPYIKPQNIIGKCPLCGGKIIEGKKGYGCSNWRDGCKFVIWKNIAGKNITFSIAKQLLDKGETKEIKEFTSKKGNKFNAQLVLNKSNGKVSFKENEKTAIGKCPLCNGEIIENSKAYGCSNWKDGCKFVIWKNIDGKNITSSIAKELLDKGETKEIKGFTSKKGNKFNAQLVLDQSNGKVFFKENEKTVIGKCPLCNGEIIENSKAYGCSNWRNGCKFVIWKNIDGKNITPSIAKELLSKKVTKKINGFVSRNNKIFDAKLIINEKTGKVEFIS